MENIDASIVKEPSGRKRSGHARMDGISAEDRRALASKAAQARWANSKFLSEATHAGEIDLVGVGINLPCAVLADGTRVLTEHGFLRAIGRSGKAGGTFKEEDSGEIIKYPPFLEAGNLSPFISDELRENARPIPFKSLNGTKSWGYRAEILPQVCEVYLKARDNGVVLPRQRAAVEACSMLVRGLAQVGIIALVDEATGYERDREQKALAKILEAFIDKELRPYITTFPADYYENLFRLRNVEYSSTSVKRPQYFGMLTNDIVYSRLAPGVLKELKKVVPRNEDGRPTAKFFQKLTQNIGYPKLLSHLGAVIALMKISSTYNEFKRRLDQHYPVLSTGQLLLPLSFEADGNDNGL